MNQSDTHQLLQSLHKELSETNEVDADTLDLLKNLVEDYHRLAGQQHMTDQINQLIQSIELGHPRLSSLVQQLTDTLASLGI